MTWFKVDDTLATHPKARMAGLPAMGLWAVAGAYASQHLTDGYVPAWYVQTWPQGAKLAKCLVDAGLWCATDGGWRYHQWEERQPTKAKVEEEREKTRARQQAWRDKHSDRTVSNVSSNGVTDDVTNAAPTRPDPTRPKEEEPKSGARKRGTRITEDWMPSAEVKAKMLAERPGVDYRTEHQNFIDHFLAASGTNATKVDWDAAWRKWMRSAREDPNKRTVREVPRMAYESPAQVPAEPMRWES